MIPCALPFGRGSEKNFYLQKKAEQETLLLESVKPYVKADFFHKIMNNDREQLSDIGEITTVLGLDRIPNTVICGGFHTKAEECDTLPDFLENYIMYFFPNERPVIYFNQRRRFIALLSLSPSLDPNQRKQTVINCAVNLQSGFRDTAMVNISMGISSSYDKTEDLGAAYGEASRALSYSSLFAEAHVIHIEDINTNIETSDYLSVPVENLAACLLQGDAEQMASIVGKIFWRLMGSQESDFNTIRSHSFELIDQIFSIAAENGFIGLDSGGKRIVYLKKLLVPETIEDIFDCVKRITVEIMEIVKSEYTSRYRQIINMALQYIEQKYPYNINLDDVAAHVYISPSYFGWLFKREVGATFTEYLTSVRIDVAKGLLMNTSKTVSEISELVGYMSANYFSQVFYKLTGVRPTAYRNARGAAEGRASVS